MFLYVEHTKLIEELDLEDRDTLIWILIHYMEDRTEPSEEQLQSMSKPLQGMWGLIKKDIINYDNKAKSGSEGGKARARKYAEKKQAELNQTSSLLEPPLKQTSSDIEPSFNQTSTTLQQKEKENKKENIKEKDYVVATQQPGISSDIPDFISFNPRESPYVQNPPTVDEMVTYAQASCIPNFTRELAQRLIDYYQSGGWVKKNGQVVRDWHPLVRQWASEEQKQKTKEQEEEERMNEIFETGYRAYEKQWGSSRACIG